MPTPTAALKRASPGPLWATSRCGFRRPRASTDLGGTPGCAVLFSFGLLGEKVREPGVFVGVAQPQLRLFPKAGSEEVRSGEGGTTANKTLFRNLRVGNKNVERGCY